MYAVTSCAFVSRTRATLRRAEFGFFGVVVYTRMQTPRFCGHASIAGVFDFFRTASRPWRTSWLIVGMVLHRLGLLVQRQNPHFITESPCTVKHLGGIPSSPHPAAATEPSPSPSAASAAGAGGSKESMLSSGRTASPGGVSTSTRV